MAILVVFFLRLGVPCEMLYYSVLAKYSGLKMVNKVVVWAL